MNPINAFNIYKMKFFKNSLNVEDFIKLLAEDRILEVYTEEELKIIAEDLELSLVMKEEAIDYSKMTVVNLRKELKSRGLSTKGKKAVLVAKLEEDGDESENKGEAILRKIKEMEDPKEFIKNKMKEENIEAEKHVETMSGANLVKLLRKEGLEEGGYNDRMRDRLQKFYENSLSWEEYRTHQLSKELKERNLIMDTAIISRYKRGNRPLYRESAIKILNLYEDGDLISNFKDNQSFDDYVTKMLEQNKLSNKGSKKQKHVRFFKSILERLDSRTDGSLKELRDRIISVILNKNIVPENLSRKGLESHLNKFSANIEGSDDELRNRLTRFFQKNQSIEDYSTDRIKQKLKLGHLSEQGSREDLITRYEIVSLKHEVVRLKRALNDCNRRKNRTITKYSNEKNKKSSSSGFGSFVGGAIVGSILSRRNEQKPSLKF